jgi:subtilisin-like proprotein convertase family protein
MPKASHLLAVALVALATDGRTPALNYNFSGGNTPIPDGEPSGLVDAQSINDAPGVTIADLRVTLDISGTGLGGFNGDLYVTLQHDNGFAVLLNRLGARSGVPYGYGDSGLSVTLDDAATGDLHKYRQVLNGDDSIPLAGILTGTWSPDARNVDPSVVLDSSLRTDFLSSFIGTSVNGTWSLFVTDLSTGGTQQLDGWGLEIVAVPEPSSLSLAVAGLLGLALWRRLGLR